MKALLMMLTLALGLTACATLKTPSDSISEDINKNWFYAGKEIPSGPVEVQVYLDKNGTLDDVKIIKSSGSKSFDASLIHAIRRADPLPIPPSRIEEYREFNLVFEPSQYFLKQLDKHIDKYK